MLWLEGHSLEGTTRVFHFLLVILFMVLVKNRSDGEFETWWDNFYKLNEHDVKPENFSGLPQSG